jgi:hypothetical protein
MLQKLQGIGAVVSLLLDSTGIWFLCTEQSRVDVFGIKVISVIVVYIGCRD